MLCSFLRVSAKKKKNGQKKRTKIFFGIVRRKNAKKIHYFLLKYQTIGLWRRVAAPIDSDFLWQIAAGQVEINKR